MDEDDDLCCEPEETDEDWIDSPEPGENLNWPTAVVYVAFFITAAMVLHDCLSHAP